MKKYPFHIEDTEPVACSYPNDSRTGAVRFRFKDKASRHSVDRLVDDLPEGHTISFFDPGMPQWSDPGAYFTVLRSEAALFIQAGNHGWMTKFRVEIADNIKGLIWACRMFNRDTENQFTVERYLCNAAKCVSYGGRFEKVYLERIAALQG